MGCIETSISNPVNSMAKISVTSPIVINVSTRELLGEEIKSSFVSCFRHLNNKNNVCKQISSLFYGLITLLLRNVPIWMHRNNYKWLLASFSLYRVVIEDDRKNRTCCTNSSTALLFPSANRANYLFSTQLAKSRAMNQFVQNGTVNFERIGSTEISGPPPDMPEVIPNIPVGRNRGIMIRFHLTSDRRFRNFSQSTCGLHVSVHCSEMIGSFPILQFF